MVGKMTLEEKLSLTAGVKATSSCPGSIPPIPRLNFTGMCLADAGQGLRGVDFVSSWPSGVHVGASWNRALALRRALGMGGEFKKKGANILLGPVVGPMGRTVRGGRNWEGFSIDPYLSGILVDATVRGIQQAGVIAATKHFVGNEQETHRIPSGDVAAVSSNIDDRTMHEIYLWPFQDAVHAGTGSVMCSYQRINNSYGCSNSKTMNGLLKTELGFQGHVVSDWNAQHAGVATALAGLDLTMPDDGKFWGPKLIEAVQNGSVPEARATDMAIRILAPWFKMGQDQNFPPPGIGMPADVSKPHTIVDGRNSSDKPTLLDGAVEGHVLVKNARNALPLRKPRMISIFGYSAKAPDTNNYAAGNMPSWIWGGQSMQHEDLVKGFGNSWEASYVPAPVAINGTIFSGGGSGATSQSLVSAPFDAITQQCLADDTAMFWDFVSARPTVNPTSDACLVIVNAAASEGYDRPALRDDLTDGMIRHVADQCNNTIVVFHNAGPRLVDQFVDHDNVTALIFAHLPGQSSGVALASILWGRANPSGRLPYTVARNESDYAGVQDPALARGRFANFPQADFNEGLFVDYRHFDAAGVAPRYEFGFGLSYTTFAYANLRIDRDPAASWEPAPPEAGRPAAPGGPAALWDVLARVSVDVSNTGAVAGAEVAQLYLSLPWSGGADGSASRGGGSERTPARQLRGFEKPVVQPGQTATVEFALTRRDLSVWDVAAQRWLLRSGAYTVHVGGSSRNLPINGTFTVP
ncbi:hypothetical protein RB594_008253 [Gaeumannomyces avenae]